MWDKAAGKAADKAEDKVAGMQGKLAAVQPLGKLAVAAQDKAVAAKAQLPVLVAVPVVVPVQALTVRSAVAAGADKQTEPRAQDKPAARLLARRLPAP